MQRPVLKSLLDLLTLVSQLERQHVARVFLVAMPATVLSRDASLSSTILRLGIVLTHAIVTLRRFDSDILVEEFFRSEIVHEVLRRDEATLLVRILQQYLIQALDDRLHDFLEAELHRPVLVIEGADVLAKLLVNLADHPVEPVLHICVSQLNLLIHLDGLVVELLRSLDLNVELMDLGVGRSTALNLNIWLLVLHLQLVQLFGDLLVLMSQHVQFLLIVADGLEQLRVGRLAREKLLHDLLNIREASLRSDLLEGLLNFSCSCHLLVHLRLEEGAPELLRKEVLIHLQLVRVLVVIGSLISDLLLPSVALDTSLKSGLLVIKRFQDRC